MKLPPVDVETLSSAVRDYFQANPPVGGAGYMDKESARKLAPLVLRALKEGSAEEVLQSLYGSHVQLYWSLVMRYVEGRDYGADSSFGYHLDDNPNPLLKIFLYLNDTFESNAAFRSFDYNTSSLLFRKGFISCTPELRVASQKFITPELLKNNLHVLEGPKGTILIFDNNLVHKGTQPRVGYRDVVSVEVYPSHKPFDLVSVEKSLANPYKTDYPTNPFRNDIQSSPL